MRKKLFVSALFMFFVLTASPAFGMLLNSVANGNDLAGATLSVNFQNAGLIIAPIVAAPALTGTSTAPGMFSFSVSGDTFNNIWNLQNLTTGDTILSATFNLAGSISLFDDNSNPSTPNSAAGRAGAVFVAGPAITGSAEAVLWPDIQNLGDMYMQENIFWANFGPGMISQWNDDTDKPVPEPSTFLLVGACFIALVIYRRKRMLTK